MFSDETEKYKKIEETNELFNKLKTVIGDGDSLMWEYDIKEDKMHIDLELRDPAKPSKLKECSLTSRKDFYQLVPTDDRQRVLTEAFDKLVKGEIKGYTAQYRRLFRNEYIWVKAIVQPYKYDENGHIEETHRALDDINLDIEQGQFIAVLGHNGSGKSTLAKHINALLYPTEGAMVVDGINTSTEEEIWKVRQKAGMVFQNPDNQIIGSIVEEDVGFGPENMGVETDEIWRRVNKSLEATGMTAY